MKLLFTLLALSPLSAAHANTMERVDFDYNKNEIHLTFQGEGAHGSPQLLFTDTRCLQPPTEAKEPLACKAILRPQPEEGLVRKTLRYSLLNSPPAMASLEITAAETGQTLLLIFDQAKWQNIAVKNFSKINLGSSFAISPTYDLSEISECSDQPMSFEIPAQHANGQIVRLEEIKSAVDSISNYVSQYRVSFQGDHISLHGEPTTIPYGANPREKIRQAILREAPFVQIQTCSQFPAKIKLPPPPTAPQECAGCPIELLITKTKADGSLVTLQEISEALRAFEQYAPRHAVKFHESGLRFLGQPYYLPNSNTPRAVIKAQLEQQFPFIRIDICPLIEHSPTITGSN